MLTRTGFTLIETLIAIVLLEVALLGLASVLTQGERLLARGRLATQAAAQGHDLLARVAQADSVCAAPTGARTFPGARLSWSPEASPSLRRVVVIVERARPATAESLATVVHCS